MTKTSQGGYSHYTPLRTRVSVAISIHDPGHTPGGTQAGSDDREAQTGNHQRDDVGRQVLGEVGVGALSCTIMSVVVVVELRKRGKGENIPQLKAKALGSLSATSLAAYEAGYLMPLALRALEVRMT